MRTGFTLAEVLVTVAVVGILAAIIFPVLGAARERGRAAACTSHQKQLVTAILLAAGDAGDVLPPSATVFRDVRVDERVLHCPGAAGPDISYTYNPRIGGRVIGSAELAETTRIVVTADQEARHRGAGGRIALASFLDGHVGPLPADEIPAAPIVVPASAPEEEPSRQRPSVYSSTAWPDPVRTPRGDTAPPPVRPVVTPTEPTRDSVPTTYPVAIPPHVPERRPATLPRWTPGQPFALWFTPAEAPTPVPSPTPAAGPPHRVDIIPGALRVYTSYTFPLPVDGQPGTALPPAEWLVLKMNGDWQRSFVTDTHIIGLPTTPSATATLQFKEPGYYEVIARAPDGTWGDVVQVVAVAHKLIWVAGTEARVGEPLPCRVVPRLAHVTFVYSCQRATAEDPGVIPTSGTPDLYYLTFAKPGVYQVGHSWIGAPARVPRGTNDATIVVSQ